MSTSFGRSTPSRLPLLIDTDNALGSPSGDVDDAFALTALLRGSLPIVAISSVGGNTSEEEADRNNRRLGALLGYAGPYLRGAKAGDARAGTERVDRTGALSPSTARGLRVASLGPLTNVAALLRGAARGDLPAPAEVIVVGSTLRTRGRWPPWWPHEFNLTHDLAATRAVFDSEIPLTLLPLDVARRLRVGFRELAALRGKVGEVLRRGARRWCTRSILIRGSSRFPVYDLLAAYALAEPQRVETQHRRVRLHPNGWVEFGVGERAVEVVTDFRPEEVWEWFVSLANEHPST
jgi:inosine-uridine nucleoside N-ribohydrolase